MPTVQAAEVKRWEYKVVSIKAEMQELGVKALAEGLDQKQIDAIAIPMLEGILNKLGEEGWEYVAISGSEMTFKREKLPRNSHNELPLPKPASVTPAAGAKVAPPPGAGGR